MEETIKILADITKQEIKRSMGINIEYNQRNGWHLTKNIHISDNESKKDSTTNNQPPPLLKDTNSPI